MAKIDASRFERSVLGFFDLQDQAPSNVLAFKAAAGKPFVADATRAIFALPALAR